jgi:hypothetical protein
MQSDPNTAQMAPDALAPECCPGFMARTSARLERGCPAYPRTPMGDEAGAIGDEADIGDAAPQTWNNLDASTAFDMRNTSNHSEVTLVANYTTSLDKAHANPAQVAWTITDKMLPQMARRVNGTTGDLAKAVLIGVDVMNVRSTAPVTLAADFPGVTGSTLLSDGTRTALLIHPNTSQAIGASIHTPDESIYSKDLQKYAGVSEDSLRADLLPKKNEDYTYTPIGHAVADIVMKNAGKLNLAAECMHIYDGQHKFPNVVVDMCISAITNAVKKMPYTPLDGYTITLRRADCHEMGSAANVEKLGANSVITHELLKQGFNVEIVFKLRYVLV